MLIIYYAKNRFNYCTCGKSQHKIEDVIILSPFVMYIQMKQLIGRETFLILSIGIGFDCCFSLVESCMLSNFSEISITLIPSWIIAESKLSDKQKFMILLPCFVHKPIQTG